MKKIVMKPPVFRDREFKLWDYAVSHKQMVIRSLGPEEGDPNLDLHFRGVEYVRAPTVFRGLAVVAPSEEEVAEARAILSPRHCEPEMVWILETSGKRYVVVAADLGISETDYPMMSTALIHPAR